MSTNGETADLMVRESIQITESAVKLAGLGAKNLAALLLAIANDQQKVAGKTTLNRLIRSGEELSLFSIKASDLEAFRQEGKRYGILYCPIINKAEKENTVEIMARARDAKQINLILERFGYPLPKMSVKHQESAKEERNATQSVSDFIEQENGASSTKMVTNIEKRERESVKKKLTELKESIEKRDKARTKEHEL